MVIRPFLPAMMVIQALPPSPVTTVEDERALEDVLGTRSSLNFHLDTYKMLQKYLKKYASVIPLYGRT
jgi:hypothetical protein